MEKYTLFGRVGFNISSGSDHGHKNKRHRSPMHDLAQSHAPAQHNLRTASAMQRPAVSLLGAVIRLLSFPLHCTGSRLGTSGARRLWTEQRSSSSSHGTMRFKVAWPRAFADIAASALCSWKSRQANLRRSCGVPTSNAAHTKVQACVCDQSFVAYASNSDRKRRRGMAGPCSRRHCKANLP